MGLFIHEAPSAGININKQNNEQKEQMWSFVKDTDDSSSPSVNEQQRSNTAYRGLYITQRSIALELNGIMVIRPARLYADEV